jgi:tetratricopeptide (TPR) repeat protein
VFLSKLTAKFTRFARFDRIGRFNTGLKILCLTLLFSCSGSPQVREIQLDMPALAATRPSQPIQPSRTARENQGGVTARVRALCDNGSVSALREAAVILKENGVEQSEFGRVMGAVIAALLEKVYGAPQSNIPEPPRNHAYGKILSEAGRGIYREPPPESADYLEYVLPFLALLDDTSYSRFAAALPDLEKAATIDPAGVLSPYFTGFAMERMEKYDEAVAMYNRALSLSPDCYPAVFGITRILQTRSLNEDAIKLLATESRKYPDNVMIKRELARAYFHDQDWDNAEALLEQTLEDNPDDPALNLMRASVLFENGRYVQTQALLDRLAAVIPEDRDYLLLRARLQNEGFKNRENAVAILNPLYRLDTDDFPVALYLARLMLESSSPSEQAEGRKMLQALMRPRRNGEDIPLDAVLLASSDAVRRADWQEARGYQDRILAERRTSATLLDAFRVAQGSGDSRTALALAQELVQDYPSYERGRLAYAEALINSGRHSEALRLIDERIPVLGSGASKSRYYYFRGILRGDMDSAISDFRSSLFENPRNLDALKALIELYHKRGDTRHVVYYLRQALAIAPKDPILLRYQKDYEASL